jgi:hypothetical protein
LFVLGDIALATLVSTLFIGFTATIVGAFGALAGLIILAGRPASRLGS